MTIKSEMETIINWTGDDEVATVYSLMPRIWRMCIQAGGEEVNLHEGVRGEKKIARTYLVPIKAIRIRKQRNLTGPALQKAKERGRRLAAARMGLEPSQQSRENEKKGQSGEKP